LAQCTELICNITVIDLPPYLYTAATIPWETSQVHNDNFQSYQPTHYSCQDTTSYNLSAQPVRVQVQLLQQEFKMSSFFIHTGLKYFPPFVCSINALQQSIPCVDHAISFSNKH